MSLPEINKNDIIGSYDKVDDKYPYIGKNDKVDDNYPYKGTIKYGPEVEKMPNREYTGFFDDKIYPQGHHLIKFNKGSIYEGNVVDGQMTGKGVLKKIQSDPNGLDMWLNGNFSNNVFLSGEFIIPRYDLSIKAASVKIIKNEYYVNKFKVKKLSSGSEIIVSKYKLLSVKTSKGTFYSMLSIMRELEDMYSAKYAKLLEKLYEKCRRDVISSVDINDYYNSYISEFTCSNHLTDKFSRDEELKKLVSDQYNEDNFDTENAIQMSERYKKLVYPSTEQISIKNNPVLFDNKKIFKKFYAQNIFPMPIKISMLNDVSNIEFAKIGGNYPVWTTNYVSINSLIAESASKGDEIFDIIVDTGNSAITLMTYDLYEFLTPKEWRNHPDPNDIPKNYNLVGIGGRDLNNKQHVFYKLSFRFKNSPETGIISVDTLVVDYITATENTKSKGILFGLTDRNGKESGINNMLKNHNMKISLR